MRMRFIISISLVSSALGHQAPAEEGFRRNVPAGMTTARDPGEALSPGDADILHNRFRPDLFPGITLSLEQSSDRVKLEVLELHRARSVVTEGVTVVPCAELVGLESGTGLRASRWNVAAEERALAEPRSSGATKIHGAERRRRRPQGAARQSNDSSEL